MTWLGEICKIFRDLVERIHKYEVKILLKMANFEDFPSIFCLTAVLFAIGGGEQGPCKIFTSGGGPNNLLSTKVQISEFKT